MTRKIRKTITIDGDLWYDLERLSRHSRIPVAALLRAGARLLLLRRVPHLKPSSADAQGLLLSLAEGEWKL